MSIIHYHNYLILFGVAVVLAIVLLSVYRLRSRRREAFVFGGQEPF